MAAAREWWIPVVVAVDSCGGCWWRTGEEGGDRLVAVDAESAQRDERRETLKHALRAPGFWLSDVFGFAGRCGGAAWVTRTVTSASASANTIIMMAVAT